MLSYSFGSDLHVDHPQPKTPQFNHELVILAGDTSNGLVGVKFINKLQRRGHRVFAVTGNHEHYGNERRGRSFFETEEAFYAGIGQDRHVWSFEDDEIDIIGANGWYHVEDEGHWRTYMNDASQGRLRASFVNQRALADAEFIERQLIALPAKHRAVVVTHTSPSEQSLDPRYAGHPSNAYYFNPHMVEIMKRFADRIAVWHHGHTHCQLDHVVHGVRVITNPRGYPGEVKDWKPMDMVV